ncbi:hypothetical protein C2I18_21985 [Paenibacillus sp. PK3_47]|uniref:hypothetical protein n=1 Tax=Paenibacillus sp. PK3_47 TaxID=2072642 RepID=UPI00201DA122|nr:hypothetical protein [Paenibacillus sp. PK3_47]UQZ35966.1 hypothetical protein C2I18_21985 [Paenibacillus sp. PK3_47]
MIDFENMLWGVDVDHFSILFERYFINDKSALNAFFTGYGADILVEKNIQIKICCIKLALGDILWGSEYNIPRVTAYGRDLLKSDEMMNAIW